MIFARDMRPSDGIRLDFSPARPVKRGGEDGPSSNTGQKGASDEGIIDYLTLVIPRDKAAERGLSDLNFLVHTLFGVRDELRITPLREKRWQFYQLSALILDREGELVGRIGVGGNHDTICVSLSGAGCRYIASRDALYLHAQALHARISRIDCAHDDVDGRLLNVHRLRERAHAGDFAQGGRPPSLRFLSDEGSGTGSTLYVGGKGHKELCIYEKGKQLGLTESPWVRAEVRLYGKHMEIPLDVLLRPMEYMRGAYDVLAELLVGASNSIKSVRAIAAANAESMVRWMRRQIGQSVGLLRAALGDEWAEFMQTRIARDGRPARFRGLPKDAEFYTSIRSQLCPASS